MAFNSEMTFWSGTSPLSSEYNRLRSELVPDYGKCDTLEGELLRASSRIYYDYYNNGFGNNWSGAYNFLDEHLGLTASERKALRGYARGKIINRARYGRDTAIASVLENLSNRVVNHILNIERSGNGWTLNHGDMFELQEKSSL